MFGFLNTTFLIGLVGVGIPIVIHLFARKQKKRIEFSSTFFLKELQNQHIRRLKFKQLVLLILRCLAILFIVLAFARPTCRSTKNAGKSIAKSSMVIIGDRTMSMSRTGFDSKFKEMALSIVDLFRSEDEAAVLWTVPQNHVSPVFLHQIQRIREQLTEWQSSSEWVFLPQKIDEGIELLSRSNNVNREIFILSDLQKSNFEEIQDSSDFRNWDGRLYVLPIFGETENIGLTGGSVENRIREAGNSMTLFADLKHYGSSRAENLLIRVLLDDRAVDQKLVVLNGGENVRLRFRIMPLEPGWHSGVFQSEDDALLQDNRWYFTFFLPETHRVLLVGNHREDITPIRLALNPENRIGQRFQIVEKYSGDDWIENLNEADAVFFSNYPELNDNEVQLLKNYIETGGGVFYLLGSNVDIRNLNAGFLEPFLGLSIAGVKGRMSSSEGFYSFGSVDFKHPLFDGVFEKGKPNIQSPRIYRLAEISGNQPVTIVAAQNGDPILIENHDKKGTVLLLTTGLSEQWSDLKTSTLFAPLIQRGAAMLSIPASGQMDAYRAGDVLQFCAEIEDMEDDYFVETPTGDRLQLFPNLKDGKAILNCVAKTPGIYTFYREDRPLVKYAVNFDVRESDLIPINEKAFQEYFPHAEIVFVKNIDPLKQKVLEARRGREFWRESILLGLLVLAVEMIVSKARKSQYSDER